MRGRRNWPNCSTPPLAQSRAHAAGLTGPPGVGKSTLTNALLRDWRARGETVGVIAVDPSSRRTGGALLGDRARMATDPEDQGVFVRSMAARDRLGGLSDQTIAAAALMRALFDRVLIESVGIGQSEADISFAVDSVILCVQPGSGDSLQFMKAGVMELPDIVVVTKADMGEAASRAKNEVQGALTLFERDDDWRVPVILASAAHGDGMEELHQALADIAPGRKRGGALYRAAPTSKWPGSRNRSAPVSGPKVLRTRRMKFPRGSGAVHAANWQLRGNYCDGG